MAQVYSEFGPRKKLPPDFMSCFEGVRPDSKPVMVAINDWDRPLTEDEKPFPQPSWRTTNNPEKLSDAPTKFKTNEAIERVKAQLAFRGVRV